MTSLWFNPYVYAVVTPPTSSVYPPIALTSNSTSVSNQAYGNGAYATSGSTAATASFSFWKVFDKGTAGAWVTGTRYFADGTPRPGASLNGINGDHVIIQMPVSITMTSYALTVATDNTSRINQQPRSWTILGSNDTGTTWTVIETQTTAAWTSQGEKRTYVVSSSTSFSSYAIVVQTIGLSASSGAVAIGEWEIFGF